MDASIIKTLEELHPKLDNIRNDIKARVTACLDDFNKCQQFTPDLGTLPPLVRKTHTDAQSARMKHEDFIRMVTQQVPRLQRRGSCRGSSGSWVSDAM
jgi:hypothetical protein